MIRSYGATSVFTGVALLAGAACSQQPQASSDNPTRSVGAVIVPSPPPTDTPPSRSGSAPDLRPRLAKLEQEARALAKTDGCTGVGGCRTAPVGWRGCGGPRTYLVYCAASTDTVALFRKLKELENAERAYNATSGMMSTCDVRMPPAVKLVGQRCSEAGTGP